MIGVGSGRSRAWFVYAFAALILLASVLILGREIELHLRTLDAWIAGLGPWGMLAFVVVLVVGTSLMLPESVFAIAAGVLFGMTWGLIASVVANVLAALLQYALARRLLLARIQRAVAARPSLAALQRAVRQQELRLQVLVRLTPINPATASYLFGAAGVRPGGYLLACLGLVPHLALEVYLGHAGKHVAGLAGGARGAAWHDAALLGGLTLTSVAVVVVSRVAHRALTEAMSEVRLDAAAADAQV